MPKYPWIFGTIVSVWLSLTFILWGASDRVEPTSIFMLGASFTTIVAVIGFRSGL